MSDPPEISILLLGDAGVGKSTFMLRLSDRSHTSNLKSLAPLHDLDQPFVFEVRLFNRPYRFEFSDTASPTNYTLLRPDVVVICFDITNRASLQSVEDRWSQQVRFLYLQHREIPVLLMGLKRDLRTEKDIRPQEALRLAQQLRCDRYMECSAATGELMFEVFEDIARTAAGTTTSTGGLSEGGCVLM